MNTFIRLLFALLVVLFLFSCSDDESSLMIGDSEVIELKAVSVNIQLPEGSAISSTDLSVSSLFTTDASYVEEGTDIETFDDNSIELTYSTNTAGNIIMMSYFNPNESNEIIINSESTAIALAMLHPWTFDLSVNAKNEAIDFIRNLPEFEEYRNVIESSISSGALDPLNAQVVLDKVSEIQELAFGEITVFIEPLRFNVENSMASVKNLLSSASYSVGLYDENDVLIEHKPAFGKDKSHFLFSEFRDNVYQESENTGQNAIFDIPSDGNWILKAKSGLSFDGSLENQQAAYHNTRIIVANIFGIFSSKFKDLIKGSDCMLSIGQNVFDGAYGSIEVSKSILAFSNGNKSGYALTKDLLFYLSNRFQNIKNIVQDCASETTDLAQLKNLQSSFLGQIFGIIDVVSKLETVFNSTAMLTDWIQYDNEIEFCFTKNNIDFEECGLKNQIQIMEPEQLLDFSGSTPYITSFGQDNTLIAVNDSDLRVIIIKIYGNYADPIVGDGTYEYDPSDFGMNNFWMQFYHDSFSQSSDQVNITSGTLTISKDFTEFDFDAVGIVNQTSGEVEFRGNLTLD